ncbi:hypothetical protein LINPERHAP2_LOCUS38077 [Linum perenne]
MTNLYPFILMILLSFSLSSPSTSKQIITSLDSLDQLIRDYAFEIESSMHKTGEIHSVDLPSNLSGVKARAARFRCGSLTRYGARIEEFGLGIGVMLYPCVERVMVVTYNLGINRSTSIYNASYKNKLSASGYQLLSPILGLTAYNFIVKSPNSSYPFQIGIRSSQGNPITINFSNITSTTHHGNISTTMCASFEKDGNVILRKPISHQVCGSTSNGHYALVVKIPPPPPATAADRGGGRAAEWKVAVGSSVGGVLGIVLLGLLVVAMLVKVKKKAKMVEMERRAYEEEALQVSMVGHVRAPVASGTRTQPTIEHPSVHTL